MAITVKEHSLKNQVNAANPNALADMLRSLKFGNMLRAMTTFLRKKDPVASPYQYSSLHAFLLPDDAKAVVIHHAYARAGTATPAELGVLPLIGDVPAAGQIAVAPNGDIVTLAADAWTSVDVVYQPDNYDLVEVTLAVVPGTGVCALPAALVALGAITVLESEALTGTSTGKKVVVLPAGAAAAAGESGFNYAKSAVWFAIADAVTSARLKLAVSSAVDTDALLTANSTT